MNQFGIGSDYRASGLRIKIILSCVPFERLTADVSEPFTVGASHSSLANATAPHRKIGRLGKTRNSLSNLSKLLMWVSLATIRCEELRFTAPPKPYWHRPLVAVPACGSWSGQTGELALKGSSEAFRRLCAPRPCATHAEISNTEMERTNCFMLLQVTG